MNGDKRLDKLVNRLEAEISKNGWSATRNEKDISTKLVELMHSQEFYGKYDKETETAVSPVQKSASSLLEALKKGIKPSEAELKELDKASKEFEGMYKERGGVHLKNYKKDNLVCREYAAIASYALHKVGIENDICLTSNLQDAGHAFVQIKSGAVIEATDPQTPYRENLSGTYIKNGDVVITKGHNSAIHSYGSGATRANLFYGGNFGVFMQAIKGEIKPDKEMDSKLGAGLKDFLQLQVQERPEAVAYAMSLYEKKLAKSPKPHFDKNQPITVEQAQANAARYVADMDKGEGGFFSSRGKHDGKISQEEWNKDFENKTGLKLPKDFRKGEPDLSVHNLIADNQDVIRDMVDKNKDGIIIPQEVAKTIQEFTELAKKKGEPLMPKQLESYAKELKDKIYGR